MWTFPGKTVNGTVNALLAASGAKGKSVFSNCVIEADIENAIGCMNAGGANIEIMDVASGTIEVIPTGKFASEIDFKIIPDRNATATYAIVGALFCKELVLSNAYLDIGPLWDFLRKVGASVEIDKDARAVSIRRMTGKSFSGVLEGKIPPAFSTDWGPLVQVLLTQLPGTTEYYDSVFTNRFALVPELVTMGAKAMLHNATEDKWVSAETYDQMGAYDRVRFEGPRSLHGTNVKANDIRNGAALVIAGLIADGQTVVAEALHIERGYEDMVQKLAGLGAKIEWGS